MVDILKLIDCMRARTPLWNRQSPLYTARAMKKQLWYEVVALTGVTEDEVRRKWKCLNDIFRREYNKYALRKKQDPDAEPPQWKYYYHMLFLEPQIGMRFTPKKINSEQLVDNLKDDRDDHSLDSSLAFEDLTNLADVSIKMEVLDGNSLGYDDDDADAIVEAITVSPSYENVKKEFNDDSTAAINDNDEPPTKRAKKVIYGQQQQQRLNNTNLRQTDSNVNQDNFVLSCDDVRNVSKMPKGGNTNIATNVSTENVDSTITQRLFSLEQRQFEDYKHMLQQQQQQQQQQQREQNQHHNKDDDGDYHFALSLVPTMRMLPTQRKMLLRLKIQQLLCEEAELLMSAVNQATNDK